MKFQGEEVIDKLNEFADSTLEFGSSLLKRLKTEALSLTSNLEERDHQESNRGTNKSKLIPDLPISNYSSDAQSMQRRPTSQGKHPFHDKAQENEHGMEPVQGQG